ncbi:MAG: DUF1559 domain-containing protein [Planctomycetaceae bacterium]|jgi:prepilin-type N-terminal cleavage/methylation domain-containing protein|nr:DUF1559 domain-containing protein [Planctomycetaceae bacterium]
MMKKVSKNLAFTLIELLVVISIIGLLAGLLLPAIQAARESGRRTACVNRQRNIATALLQFEASTGSFAGWRNKVTINNADATISWVTKILTLIEEPDLYKSIMESSGTTLSTIPKIPILRCPSANFQTDLSTSISYVVNGGAADDFWNESGEPVTYDNNVYNGVFLDRDQYPHIMTSIDDLNKFDGTSRTLLLSENLNAGFWIARDNISTSNCNRDGNAGSADTAEGVVAFCWGKKYPSGNYNTGDTAVYSNFARTCDLNSTGGDLTNLRLPRWINMCTNTSFSGGDWYQSARPSANHPQVIVTTFCDGHVQTISESIDEVIFVQLMTGCDSRSEAAAFIGNALQPNLSDL